MRKNRRLFDTDLDGGLNLLALVACQRPVHQVQVQVFSLQLLDGLLASLSDTAMVRIVQLASDPDILSRYFPLLEDIAECFPDYVLISVCRRTIDMPVSMQTLVSQAHKDGDGRRCF